jgi:nickel transport protein
VALLFVFCDSTALAHKVTIFAWVEGDTVHTKSKYSGGRAAKESTVVVCDKEGNQLLEGKTDENGEFSFKVPKKTDLKIALKASMGHLAEWTIPADEITTVRKSSETSAPEIGVEGTPQQDVPLTKARVNEGQAVATAVGLSRQEVKQLIDASLDRKLAPIANMLADSIDHEPTMSEVIGGIGYIFGLVGVALYFSNRRKKEL